MTLKEIEQWIRGIYFPGSKHYWIRLSKKDRKFITNYYNQYLINEGIQRMFLSSNKI